MSKRAEVWVIDDDKSIRWVLEKALHQADIHVTSFDNANVVLTRLTQVPLPGVIVSDIRMPGLDGLSLLEKINQSYPQLPVIIMTAFSDLESAVSAFQGGAFEYLPKPFDVDDAVDLVQRALQRSAEISKNPIESDTSTIQASDIIGSAPAMQDVFRAIGRLSRSNITVLITGESGTGKELVARALHRHSPRAQRPFIALNTAAIPRELLESELFGHERGAFTGALSQRQGRFEQADGGTLFLDEIGDMPSELQTRLLRVLADGTFFRVGGHTAIKVDVRIIAATHQDLESRVERHEFREDLFHRLNVIRIHIPPLRKRRGDIVQLMRHFLLMAAKELKVEPKNLTPDTEQYLMQLDWPGNVRQLENTCRWLTVMASGQEILLDDLPVELRQKHTEVDVALDWELALRQWAEQRLSDNGHQTLLDEALPRFESVMIQAALRHTGGRRQEAARLLGWGRNTLTRKIKELGMGEDEE
jgi:two-component system, NtrC family, nitrogen regulation response regulator GlnG